MIIKGMIKNYCRSIRFNFRDFIINRRNRKRLLNDNFTIICSDCTAGCVCKDLKVRMNSPTRNLYFNANDYIKFCQNLDYYLSLRLTEDDSRVEQPYLTAMCGDIRLFLVHYPTLEQAQEEWERRKKRVNYDNLFFLMNDRNGCTEQDIKEFDQLPYKNKVCFTHKQYSEYKSTYCIPGNENYQFIQSAMNYINRWGGVKRYYDYFDFVEWLNNGN